MGYSRYIGRVGALAVALGIGAALGATPWLASAEPSTSGSSVHAASTEPSSDSSSTGAANLEDRGGVGQFGFHPVDGVGIDAEVDRIADRSGDIEIGVGHLVGVGAACDAFGRSRCGGEHRRRGHQFTDRFLPVRRHRRHDG